MTEKKIISTQFITLIIFNYLLTLNIIFYKRNKILYKKFKICF